MDELFTEFEFYESTDYNINEINGMPLPSDYLEFMHKHNGGEGNVGKYAYIQLVQLEELIEYSNIYEMEKYFPHCFAFGTDLGGNLFCYDFKKKIYFSIDACSRSEEDIMFKSGSFEEFIRSWDKQFEE